MPGASDAPVVVGGTIPDADVGPLRDLGVAAVFPVGTGLHGSSTACSRWPREIGCAR